MVQQQEQSVSLKFSLHNKKEVYHSRVNASFLVQKKQQQQQQHRQPM